MSESVQDAADRGVCGKDTEGHGGHNSQEDSDQDQQSIQVRPTFSCVMLVQLLWMSADISLADAYFFFSRFQTLREMPRPQNGQKLIRNRLGRVSDERTA